ncbi:MAG: SDR family NAD(P)-dependent oxidoreductase, partial [Gammaproteobacteria bacterium]
KKKISSPNGPSLPVTTKGCYIISGGLGHIGLCMAEHLIRAGVSEIVLLSRQGSSHPLAEIIKQKFNLLGARVHILAVDVTREDSVNSLYIYLTEQNLDVKGIIHGAGTNSYDKLPELTYEKFVSEASPKIMGGWLLHKLSLNYKVDFFILLSSIASIWGAGTQSHYSAGNSFLDSLAHYRKQQGLPALSINWGMWADGGMATEEISYKLSKMGISSMSSQQALAFFDIALTLDQPQVIISKMEWPVFINLYCSQKKCTFFDAIQQPEGSSDQHIIEQPQRTLVDIIKAKLGEVLNLSAEKLDLELPIMAHGLDSIMAVELSNALAADGVNVSIADLFMATSINALVEKITNSINNASRVETVKESHRDVDTSFETPVITVPPISALSKKPKISQSIYTFEERASAPVRLLCFPYAGGSPAVFNKWLLELDENIELSSIVLPGRMHRLNEAPFKRMDDIVDHLMEAVLPLFDKTVMFFGHCLGGLIMYELTQKLLMETGKQPIHLFASGARAPQFYTPEQLTIDVMQFSPVKDVPGHELNENDFLVFLKDLNFETSTALYDDKEMRKIMLPTVQADLEANNLYTYVQKLSLSMPITAIGGRVDPYVTGQHLLGWQQQTKNSFKIHIRPGDHYFIETQKQFLIKIVNETTRELLVNNEVVYC